jgi:hypothetical protein
LTSFFAKITAVFDKVDLTKTVAGNKEAAARVRKATLELEKINETIKMLQGDISLICSFSPSVQTIVLILRQNASKCLVEMKTQFERNPYRELPDGSIRKVYPFHISLEGLETRILCREDADYDVFVKIICVCCLRKNTILVIYAVVSNHAHCVVLATSQGEADECAEEIKRMYSMYFSNKYRDQSIMKGVSSKALFISSDWYLRNALAYDVRNAMDNRAKSIQSYKWTGYAAMFCGGKLPEGLNGFRLVKHLTKADRRRIMHTNDRLHNVDWVINDNEELVPVTICDWKYFEEAFRNNQTDFLRQLGVVNTSEMYQKLVYSPRVKRCDNDFLCSVNEISEAWFNKQVHDLSVERKSRLIRYVSRAYRTDCAQLARTFEIDITQVRLLLGK